MTEWTFEQTLKPVAYNATAPLIPSTKAKPSFRANRPPSAVRFRAPTFGAQKALCVPFWACWVLVCFCGGHLSGLPPFGRKLESTTWTPTRESPTGLDSDFHEKARLRSFLPPSEVSRAPTFGASGGLCGLPRASEVAACTPNLSHRLERRIFSLIL